MFLRLFIILSIVFVITGMLWPFLSMAGIGHLPGDFVLRSRGFVLHLPITTSIIFGFVVASIVRLVR